MSIDTSEQAALIKQMNAQYARILPIETEWSIRLHEGDWRPRVEHFHDAVRALTSGEADIYQKNSRLSVEHLAYDLGQLRQIQDKPLGKISRGTQKSASTQLARMDEAATPYIKMPPQAVRAELTALYRDYMVYYAALFSDVADRNYKSRQDAITSTQQDLDVIEQVIGQLMAGKLSAGQAMEEIMHVERDDLRERMQRMLASKQLSAREKQEALTLISQIEQGLTQEKKGLDQSHMHYATGQLAVYEQSKETIKRMAAQGLNLAGRFTENALRGSGQGKGRGV